LRKGLEHRPDREDLINRRLILFLVPSIANDVLGNILADTSAAPGIQASQKALDRQMRTDALEQKLQRRPTADELVQEGILDADEKPQ